MAKMEVLIKDGSDIDCIIEDLYKNIKLVGGRPFPLKEKSFFPGCNAIRFLLAGCLLEVADKKELAGLLIDFFGRTFHLS